MTDLPEPAGREPDRREPDAGRDVADVVADAARAVPGVADLHGGMFGEAATYLPGRRVAGVRLGPQGTDVHVSLAFGAPVRETADGVRRAVAKVVGGPVHVTVEDVVG